MSAFNFNHLDMNADGTINVEETVETFREALELYKEETEERMMEVLVGVRDLLSASGSDKDGKPIKVSLDGLVGLMICRLLPKTPKEASEAKRIVEETVRDNTCTKDDLSKMFCSSTGKNGGYYLNGAHPANCPSSDE